MPFASTMRTRCAYGSAHAYPPSGSAETARGWLIAASVAWPPSPESASAPVPTTVQTVGSADAAAAVAIARTPTLTAVQNRTRARRGHPASFRAPHTVLLSLTEDWKSATRQMYRWRSRLVCAARVDARPVARVPRDALRPRVSGVSRRPRAGAGGAGRRDRLLAAAGSSAGSSRTCSRSRRRSSSPRSRSACCYSRTITARPTSSITRMARSRSPPSSRPGCTRRQKGRRRLLWFAGTSFLAAALAVRAFMTGS